MYMGTVQKQPSERFTFSVDFSDNLFTGTVASAVITSRNYVTGADTTATIYVAASVIVASPFVLFDVWQGTDGQTHIVTIKATMSGGQIVEDEIWLPIIES